MFSPFSIPRLPVHPTRIGINYAFWRNLGWLRYGRATPDREAYRKLRHTLFHLELALAHDFCTVPSGWLEWHCTYLPTELVPRRHEEFLARLERMVHAGRDQQAIRTILAAATYPAGRKLHKPLIDSLPRLAAELCSARLEDPDFVDALTRGTLMTATDLLIAQDIRMDATKARRLLERIAILWGLNDLQIIAAKLYRSVYRPTEGLFDLDSASPSTFKSVMRDPIKFAEMATIADNILRHRTGGPRTASEKDERKLNGFANGTDFRTVAEALALEMGFTPADLKRKTADPEKFKDITQLLRRYAQAGGHLGCAFKHDLAARFHDGSTGMVHDVPTETTSAQQRSANDNEQPTKDDVVTDKAGKSVGNMSASAPRYGMNETTALAYAVIDFLNMRSYFQPKLNTDYAGRIVHLSAPKVSIRISEQKRK